jgi:hypothetical protein
LSLLQQIGQRFRLYLQLHLSAISLDGSLITFSLINNGARVTNNHWKRVSEVGLLHLPGRARAFFFSQRLLQEVSDALSDSGRVQLACMRRCLCKSNSFSVSRRAKLFTLRQSSAW